MLVLATVVYHRKRKLSDQIPEHDVVTGINWILYPGGSLDKEFIQTDERNISFIKKILAEVKWVNILGVKWEEAFHGSSHLIGNVHNSNYFESSEVFSLVSCTWSAY